MRFDYFHEHSCVRQNAGVVFDGRFCFRLPIRFLGVGGWRRYRRHDKAERIVFGAFGGDSDQPAGFGAGEDHVGSDAFWGIAAIRIGIMKCFDELAFEPVRGRRRFCGLL